MREVKVSHPDHIASATPFSEREVNGVWDALLEVVRRNGRHYCAIAYKSSDGSLGRLATGVLDDVDTSTPGTVVSGTLTDVSIVQPSDDGFRFEPFDDITLNFRDSNTSAIQLTISEEVDLSSIEQTTLYAHVPSTDYTREKTVKGFDNLPDHLDGRAILEHHPRKTCAITYFEEGNVVYERFDDVRSQFSREPDTVSIDSTSYIPSKVERVFDDGIRTTHHTLRDGDLVSALGTGLITPRLAIAQSRDNNEGIHETQPFHVLPDDPVFDGMGNSQSTDGEDVELDDEVVDGDDDWSDDLTSTPESVVEEEASESVDDGDVGSDDADDSTPDNPFGLDEDEPW